MKNFFLLLFMFVGLGLSAQNINLKMPSDFFYSRTPGQGKGVKFTVSTKLDAINMIATDNVQSQRLGRNSTNKQPKGKRGILIALPKLYQIANDGNNRTFGFGKNGGEDDENDATVTLSYSNATASTELNENGQPIIFKIDQSEIYTANKNNNELTNKQDFLLVEASNNMTATLTINRNPKQGNTIVAIFNSKNGKLIGTLNPKDPNNPAATLSFTTNKSVYVIPVIRPKVTSNGGKEQIIFEVGDPRQNGSAESEEE